MRIPVHMFRLQPHMDKNILHPFPTFRPGKRMSCRTGRKKQRFSYAGPHRLSGIERRKRILKHHLNTACPLKRRPVLQRSAGKKYLPGTRRQQTGSHARKRGLAAAGLAHQTEGFSGKQLQTYIMYGPDACRTRVKQPLTHGKFTAYPSHLQQCIHRCSCFRYLHGSKAPTRPDILP